MPKFVICQWVRQCFRGWPDFTLKAPPPCGYVVLYHPIITIKAKKGIIRRGKQIFFFKKVAINYIAIYKSKEQKVLKTLK